MTRALRQANFPAPKGRVATVAVRIHFAPSTAKSPADKIDPRRGRVVLGGVGVAGGKIANASSVVARLRGRFRTCYQNGLRDDPHVKGSVVLVVKIGSRGEVREVGGGGGGGIGAIVGCLKAAVSSGGFEPPEGGSAVLSIPMTFSVKSLPAGESFR